MSIISDNYENLFNAFDPFFQIMNDEDRRKYYVKFPENLLDRLERNITASNAPLRIITAGTPGNGKSSYFANLSKKMHDTGKFLVVWLDVDELTDRNKVNYIDILYLIGATVFAYSKSFGYKPDEDYFKNLTNALVTTVKSKGKVGFSIDTNQLLDVIITSGMLIAESFGIVIPPGVKQMLPFLRSFRFPSTFPSSEEIRQVEEPEINEIVKHLNSILIDAEIKSKKKLLIFVDGLDKIDYTRSNEILTSGVLTKPASHIIYIVPSLLAHTTKFDNLGFVSYIFPNIKLHEPGEPEKHYLPGRNFMRDVISKRITEVCNLKVDQVINEEALNYIVDMSGGLLRQMMKHIRYSIDTVCEKRCDIIDKTIAEIAARQLRTNMSAGLYERHYKELEALKKTGRLTDSETATELLLNLYILSYPQGDGRIWYKVNPIIESLLV